MALVLFDDPLDVPLATPWPSPYTSPEGVTYSEHPNQTVGQITSQIAGMVTTTSNSGVIVQADIAPSGADVLVEADVHFASATGPASQSCGVVARLQAGAFTCYTLRWIQSLFSGAGGFRLDRVLAGVTASLASYAYTRSAGTTVRIGLRCEGGWHTVYFDGVAESPVNNTAVMTAGTVGLIGAVASTSSTGAHIASLKATDLGVMVGTANGELAWVGTAVGEAPADETAEGTAAGMLAWAGAAVGSTERSGAAAGALTWAGSAVGVSNRSGTAAGELAWVGTAVGTTARSGAGAGALAWVGSATGSAAAGGTGSGTLAWVGAAVGSKPAGGAGAGTLAWVGAATGAMLPVGTAVGELAWVGSAIGATDRSGAAAGELAWEGTAVGSSPNGGTGAGDLAWHGVAIGSVPGEYRDIALAPVMAQQRRFEVTFGEPTRRHATIGQGKRYEIGRST